MHKNYESNLKIMPLNHHIRGKFAAESGEYWIKFLYTVSVDEFLY